MKAVLLSDKPKWCDLIASGKKTIEVRKTRPKIDTPFKVFIYCTYGDSRDNYCFGKRGKVIGEFICDFVVDGANDVQDFTYISENCAMPCSLLYNYIGENEYGEIGRCFGWHISDLKIYDKPRELSEFNTAEEKVGRFILPSHKVKRAPQSWCYVEYSEVK